MQFQKSTISGCRRLNFNGAKSITICPTRKVQLILGTNGSGKSSLLKVLFSVLPTNKNYFFPGGYTENYIAHNGHFYYLKSIYDKKPFHIFKRDDEDLNKGGTETVQLELIKQYFNLDQNIVGLITGVEKLTKMSPARRKEWFTILSKNDFTYAFSQYNKFKKDLKITGDLIKYQSSKYTEEVSKKLSEKDVTYLYNKKKIYENEIIKQLKVKESFGCAVSLEQAEIDYKNACDKFNLNYEEFLKQTNTFECKDELSQVILDNLYANMHEQKGKLSAASDIFSNKEHNLERYRKALTVTLDEEEINNKLNHYESIKVKLQDAIKSTNYGLIEHHFNIRSEDETNIELFHEKAMLLRSCEKNRLDKDQVIQSRELKQQLNDKLKRAQDLSITLKSRKEHIEKTHSVDCPKCAYVFKPGVNESELENVEKKLQQCLDFIKTNEPAYLELEYKLMLHSKYVEELNELNLYKSKIQNLEGYFKLIDALGGISDTKVVSLATSMFLKDCKLYSQLNKVNQEIIKYTELKKTQSSNKEKSSIIEQEYKEASLNYDKCYDAFKKAQDKYVEFKSKLDNKTKILELGKTFDDLFKNIENAYQTRLNAQLKKTVDQTIEGIQINLADVSKTLTEHEMVDSYLMKLNKELDQLKQKEKALEYIVDTLCPSEGIIGSQMVQGINNIIDQMNAKINKVWGYGLYLERCNIDVTEEGLDYKLPIYTKQKENNAADVSLGSDSQMDIINFVFVLVAYELLGLEEYPLFIDELDRTFDEIHRTNLTHFIRELVDDDVFSQIFIISHFQEGHGGFTESQTVVLDKSHISISRQFNTHVTFDYEV